MVRLLVERAPLSKAGKPSRPGRRSARSGGNHRWRENPHGPPILRPGVSRRRPRKVRKKRLVDRKGAMPRRAVERGRKSASVRGQSDQEGSGPPPGLGPAPSHRSALQKDLAPLLRRIDRAVHRLIEQNGGGQRVPAVLRGLLRLGDALPDARPLLFAPNQEDRGRGDPDDRDQDPDQDRNQDEPDLDSDPDGRMDDPVARRVPRAPAILPAGRLGLLLPAKPIARQPGHPLPHPPGRRNRGSGQARPQLGRVADRAENQRVSLAGNQAESPAAGLAGNRAGDQAGDRVENRAVGHRATFRRANPRVRSPEHEREAKFAADSRD